MSYFIYKEYSTICTYLLLLLVWLLLLLLNRFDGSQYNLSIIAFTWQRFFFRF